MNPPTNQYDSSSQCDILVDDTVFTEFTNDISNIKSASQVHDKDSRSQYQSGLLPQQLNEVEQHMLNNNHHQKVEQHMLNNNHYHK